MEKLKKYLLYIFIVIFILVLILIGLLTNNKNDTIKEVKPIIKETKKVTKKENNKIKVDIKGAVNSPGVYELDDNSRVIDAINVAGGLTEDADISLINLSKKLTDEMVIIIYTTYEIYEYNESNVKTEYVYVEVNNCPDSINDACIKDYENNESNKLININTASIDELTKLTGIGEAKAKTIIEYRKDNKFNSIEDIKNITGIGDSLFEKIKNDITV